MILKNNLYNFYLFMNVFMIYIYVTYNIIEKNY
jgi:hypothetical protein